MPAWYYGQLVPRCSFIAITVLLAGCHRLLSFALADAAPGDTPALTDGLRLDAHPGELGGLDASQPADSRPADLRVADLHVDSRLRDAPFVAADSVAAPRVTLDATAGPVAASPMMTWTHTRSSGCASKCALVVELAFSKGYATDVKCGTALSFVKAATYNQARVELWVLKQPAASCAVMVAVTVGAAGHGASSTWRAVDLAKVGSSMTSGADTPATSSVNAPGMSAGGVLVDVAALPYLVTMTPGTTTKELWSAPDTGVSFTARSGYAESGAGGAINVGWAIPGSLQWVHAWLQLDPAP